jgi:hypothetical protein
MVAHLAVRTDDSVRGVFKFAENQERETTLIVTE